MSFDMTKLERTKMIQNGEKVKQTFSREEMDSRNAKLRAFMAEQGIDAVVLCSYHNICYFSDFLYTSFGRKYALVITQEKHVVVSTNIDAGMPWRKCYDENIVYTDWHGDNYTYTIKKVLTEAGITKGKIGIEYDFVTLETMAQFKGIMEGCEIVDISVDIMRQRMIKSQEEIEHIKKGAHVADIGGFAVAEAIAEGVPEYEVALHGTQAMVREIAKLYPQSDLRETWIWFQSGINTDGAHNWPTSRKIQKGDNLSLNCFPMMSGYYTALERTLFYDHVDDASLKYWEINVKVHEEGQKLIKPGARCKDICSELNAIYDEYGLVPNRTFGYGHSFGVLCHYYGREGLLEIREDIDTVLEPGMVVSMEPMIMIPEGQPGAGGYREHDIMVINYDGTVEDATKFPYGPEHNIIKR